MTMVTSLFSGSQWDVTRVIKDATKILMLSYHVISNILLCFVFEHILYGIYIYIVMNVGYIDSPENQWISGQVSPKSEDTPKPSGLMRVRYDLPN